jgi:hypothetical protein
MFTAKTSTTLLTGHTDRCPDRAHSGGRFLNRNSCPVLLVLAIQAAIQCPLDGRAEESRNRQSIYQARGDQL